MEKIILKLNNGSELKGIKNDYGFLIFLNEKITLKTNELNDEIKQEISELDENKLAHITLHLGEKVILSFKMLNLILNNFGFIQKGKFFKMFYFKTNENKKIDKIYMISYYASTVDDLEIDTIKQILETKPTVEKTTNIKFTDAFYFKLQPTSTFANIVYLTIFKNKSKKQ